MSGRVVHHVSRNRHMCSPPGWRERRKLDLDYGSLWECDCGQWWEWSQPWGYSEWVHVAAGILGSAKIKGDRLGVSG